MKTSRLINIYIKTQTIIRTPWLYSVEFGVQDLNTVDPWIVGRNITKAFVHPDFYMATRTIKNDIALLKLDVFDNI